MAKLLHRFELRIAVIAAMALCIAQLGAMAHAYSHSPDAGIVSHDVCADCLNFAPLLIAADAPTVLPLVLPQGHGTSRCAEQVSQFCCRPCVAFRSRAPPFTP